MSISVPALFQRVAQMSSGCAVVWLDPRSPKAWCKAEYVPHTRSRMAFEGAVMNPSQFRINVYHADMDNIAARYSESAWLRARSAVFFVYPRASRSSRIAWIISPPGSSRTQLTVAPLSSVR